MHVAGFDDPDNCCQDIISDPSDSTICFDEAWKPERIRIATKSAGHLAPDRRPTCRRKTVAWHRQHDANQPPRLCNTYYVGDGVAVQNIIPV